MDHRFTVVPHPFPERRREGPRVRRLTCANCGVMFNHETYLSAYCSPKCRSVTKAIRYARSLDERFGAHPPEDRVEALNRKIAFALGDGYDAGARRLSLERRAEVKERDSSRCVLCDAPGEEIDHIDGSSDRLANLRLLCRRCHDRITNSSMVPIDEPAQRQLLDEIKRRWHAEQPERACDGREWNKTWRAWAKAHEVTDSP